MPWLLAAIGVMIAFGVDWFGDILDAFQHFPGLPGRARALRFFAIGDVTWAVALLVAVVVMSVGERVLGGGSQPGSQLAGERGERPQVPPAVGARVTLAYDAIAAAAGIVVVAAVISAIIALTLAGEHATPSDQVAYSAIGFPAGFDQAVVAALSSLAAVPIAAATAVWALRSSHRRSSG